MKMSFIRNKQGFTLIELMITVTIVSILAAVAIPAYQDYVIRAKLTEALVFGKNEATKTILKHMETGNFMWTGREIINTDTIYAIEHYSPTPQNEDSIHIYLRGGLFPGAVEGHHALIVNVTPTSNGGYKVDCQPHVTTRSPPDRYVPRECLD